MLKGFERRVDGQDANIKTQKNIVTQGGISVTRIHTGTLKKGGETSRACANKRMVRTSGTRGNFGNVLSVRGRAGIGVRARRYGVPNAAHARR